VGYSRDVIIGLALIGFSALIYTMTLGLPDSSSGAGLSPASFPRALAFFIAALSLVLVAQGFWKRRTAKPPPFLGPLFPQTVLFFLVMVFYILMMPRIGYIASTLVFLGVSVGIMMPGRSARDLLGMTIFAAASTLMVYLIFGMFLKVPLIEGPVDKILRHGISIFSGAG
jgi:putative tricarboxylic transport membrane protein